MNTIATSLFVFACAFGATLLGMLLRRALPEHHRGSETKDAVKLAMGLVDVVIENGLQPYDIQALIPIVEAAGGCVTNWSGGSCEQGGPVLACGDPTLHKALVSRLST